MRKKPKKKNMEKVKIKRVKKQKKKTSVKEKILTGLGVGGALSGLVGAPIKVPPPKPAAVASQTPKQKSALKEAGKLVERFLGAPKAKADFYIDHNAYENLFSPYGTSGGAFADMSGRSPVTWQDPVGYIFGNPLQTMQTQVMGAPQSAPGTGVQGGLTGNISNATSFANQVENIQVRPDIVQNYLDDQRNNGLNIVKNSDGSYTISGGAANIAPRTVSAEEVANNALVYQNSLNNPNPVNNLPSSSYVNFHTDLARGNLINQINNAPNPVIDTGWKPADPLANVLPNTPPPASSLAPAPTEQGSGGGLISGWANNAPIINPAPLVLGTGSGNLAIEPPPAPTPPPSVGFTSVPGFGVIPNEALSGINPQPDPGSFGLNTSQSAENVSPWVSGYNRSNVFTDSVPTTLPGQTTSAGQNFINQVTSPQEQLLQNSPIEFTHVESPGVVSDIPGGINAAIAAAGLGPTQPISNQTLNILSAGINNQTPVLPTAAPNGLPFVAWEGNVATDAGGNQWTNGGFGVVPYAPTENRQYDPEFNVTGGEYGTYSQSQAQHTGPAGVADNKFNWEEVNYNVSGSHHTGYETQNPHSGQITITNPSNTLPTIFTPVQNQALGSGLYVNQTGVVGHLVNGEFIPDSRGLVETQPNVFVDSTGREYLPPAAGPGFNVEAFNNLSVNNQPTLNAPPVIETPVLTNTPANFSVQSSGPSEGGGGFGQYDPKNATANLSVPGDPGYDLANWNMQTLFPHDLVANNVSVSLSPVLQTVRAVDSQNNRVTAEYSLNDKGQIIESTSRPDGTTGGTTNIYTRNSNGSYVDAHGIELTGNIQTAEGNISVSQLINQLYNNRPVVSYQGNEYVVNSRGTEAVDANGNKLPQEVFSQLSQVPVSHTVTYGESLSQIAAVTGRTVSDIMAANPSIISPDRIYEGQHLVIPPSGYAQAQLNRPVQSPGPGFEIVHTDMGDIPRNLAEQMGATIASVGGQVYAETMPGVLPAGLHATNTGSIYDDNGQRYTATNAGKNTLYVPAGQADSPVPFVAPAPPNGAIGSSVDAKTPAEGENAVTHNFARTNNSFSHVDLSQNPAHSNIQTQLTELGVNLGPGYDEFAPINKLFVPPPERPKEIPPDVILEAPDWNLPGQQPYAPNAPFTFNIAPVAPAPSEIKNPEYPSVIPSSKNLENFDDLGPDLEAQNQSGDGTKGLGSDSAAQTQTPKKEFVPPANFTATRAVPADEVILEVPPRLAPSEMGPVSPGFTYFENAVPIAPPSNTSASLPGAHTGAQELTETPYSNETYDAGLEFANAVVGQEQQWKFNLDTIKAEDTTAQSLTKLGIRGGMDVAAALANPLLLTGSDRAGVALGNLAVNQTDRDNAAKWNYLVDMALNPNITDSSVFSWTDPVTKVKVTFTVGQLRDGLSVMQSIGVVDQNLQFHTSNSGNAGNSTANTVTEAVGSAADKTKETFGKAKEGIIKIFRRGGLDASDPSVRANLEAQGIGYDEETDTFYELESRPATAPDGASISWSGSRGTDANGNTWVTSLDEEGNSGLYKVVDPQKGLVQNTQGQTGHLVDGVFEEASLP